MPGRARRAVANRTLALTGDSLKMARAMIASVDRPLAPRRLTLGSAAYTGIRAALEGRLAALEADKDIALSTDVDA